MVKLSLTGTLKVEIFKLNYNVLFIHSKISFSNNNDNDNNDNDNNDYDYDYYYINININRHHGY